MAADTNAIARAYVDAFARDGAGGYVANLETSVALHRWGAHDVPLTINNGTRAATFVCSPRVGYVDYVREELAHFPNPALVAPLHAAIAGVAAALSIADADRIVHINNWMMSTNLPVGLDPQLAVDQTQELTARYPGHLLAIRSLTWRHSRALLDALLAAGWILLPSRQVFLVDDIERDSMPRRDTKRDAELWRQGVFHYEEADVLTPADAERIVALYNLLYLEKYSRLNPHYTVGFVLLTHRIGLIRYLLLRGTNGMIDGFGGVVATREHATMPLIGYDTAVPQEHGLYRLIFHAGARYAARHRLKLNMSSGASQFKLNRGAKGEIEFTAFHVRHLPRHRRIPFAGLASFARLVGIPLLKRYKL